MGDLPDTGLIRPLTTHERDPAVSTELMAIQYLAPHAVARKVKDGRLHLRLETLVAVLRWVVRLGHENLREYFLARIFEQASGGIASILTSYGVASTDDRNDVIQEFYALLCDHLPDPAVGREFWECRFWFCARRRLQNIVKKLRRESTRTRGFYTTDEDGSEQDILDVTPDRRNHLLDDLVHERDLLRQIPARLREVLILEAAGYPAESGVENSIANILDVSGRAVRYRQLQLRQLLATLDSKGVDPGESPGD